MSDDQIRAFIRVWDTQRSSQLERHAVAFMQITWNGRWENVLALPAARKSLERFAWFMYRAIHVELEDKV